MLERGPYTILPPKNEEKSKRLMYRPALHYIVEAGEMWERGPYTVLPPKKKKKKKKDEEKSKRLMYRSETDSRP